MRRPKLLRDGLSIVIGYLPAGMTFGILARDNGIRFADAIGFSGLVFAGASQYMAINLIAAGAATLQIIVATFLLNFRHFLMSAALSRKITTSRTPVRLLVAYGITDETFAIASVYDRITPGYLASLNFIAWSCWLTGTVAGFLTGSLLPQSIESALGVALYALFAGLLVPLLKSSIRFVVPAASAAGLHVLLAECTSINPGWAFVLAVVGAGIIGTAVTHRRGKEV